MKKIVGIVVAVAVLAGAVVAAALVTSAGSASASKTAPVAYDCQGTRQGQTRPAEILLDCLSGNVLVKTPGWRYWTATSARSGSATLWVRLFTAPLLAA